MKNLQNLSAKNENGAHKSVHISKSYLWRKKTALLSLKLSILKPPFEYNVFGQTRILVNHEVVCQSNILFGCPNICSKDTERIFSSLGFLLIKIRFSMTGEKDICVYCVIL